MLRPLTHVLVGLSILLGLSMPVTAQGTPLGFAEQFALAKDRGKALEQLIPGTADYYYYNCRHRQNTGEFAEVNKLLRAWIQRYGRTRRVIEIENRQALLTYVNDPKRTMTYLQRQLGLSFAHQRQSGGAKQDLASQLDPRLVADAAFRQQALRNYRGTVNGFRESAFDSLIVSDLDDNLLMSLLSRLQRPDYPNLPALVVRNLGHRRTRGFGSLRIHNNLLTDQLEECVRLRPRLLNEQRFVQNYLVRLRPNADVQWQVNAGEKQAYLGRLQAFAARLSAAHNSLKAHVLFHRLRHDLQIGKPDKDRFLAYLRLPRSTSYTNPDYLRRIRRGSQLVDMRRRFPTALDPVGNDEPVVRSYFEHFFAKEDSFQPYTAMVRERYLRRLFAETKILAGLGDMERWYSMLDDPTYYEALKERVEIRFPATQSKFFAASEDVAIDVDIKNVSTLLVKVFEINTFNFYRQTNRQVDASINIDGLVANKETTHKYTDSPLRRVRRQFKLPSLRQPGVYIVEFLGNGISSRAVIHKGRLRHFEREGAAGHVFTVLDEAGKHLRDASVWFGGRQYAADEDGEIVIPFSTKPGARKLILRHGSRSTLTDFEHRAENYRLLAGVHVDREALKERRRAKIMVRPTLLLNGRSVSLELLENPVLTITSRDGDGVASTLEVRAPKLSSDRESVHEIEVPTGLATLSVTLRGRVRNMSRGKHEDLGSSPRRFDMNGIEKTAQTSCPLLSRSDKGYVLDVLGKDGEPKADRAVRLSFDHRDYNSPIAVSLKTDARGRIRLGMLPGIWRVKASGYPTNIGGWRLRPASRSYPSFLHGLAGETLHVPYQGEAKVLARSLVSLLELRGGALARDAFDRITLTDGAFELRGLAPGDYDLWVKEPNKRITVRVTAGQRRGAGTAGSWALGKDRWFAAPQARFVRVNEMKVVDGTLRIQLADASKDTRVHVTASRYVAPFDSFAALRGPALPTPEMIELTHADSTYHSGREIGGEYRYILERRFAKKFPGNMLQRPGLILNPWAVDDAADTAVGLGGGAGGRFGGRRGGRAKRKGRPGGSSARPEIDPGVFSNVAFLPEPAPAHLNLTPDANGVVQVPVKDLGDGQLVHVLAVDGDSTTYRTMARAEQPLAPRSRRLTLALEPKSHVVEQRRIGFVKAGATAKVENASTAQAETYDTLASIYRLYMTLSGNKDLAKFAFLLEWPELKPAEKRALYSKHACHELHFFLHEKDQAFFKEVVRPYLANKAHKTFLDQWLLGENLAGYLDPWAFGRLNTVERILLSRRLEGGVASLRRHVRELVEMLPPDPARRNRLFEGALRSGELAAASDIRSKLENLKKFAEHRAAPKKSGRPDPSEAPRSPRPAGRRGRAGEADEKKAMKEQDEEVEEEIAETEEMDDADKMPADRAGKREQQKGKDMKRRKNARALYRAPDPTQQLVEHNYWHRRIQEHNADLVRANKFWQDFADSPLDQPFFSIAFAEASGNFAEMMFALAVLDLPFKAGKHGIEMRENVLTMRAATPLLLVRKELVESAAVADAAPILVSQNFFRLDERYRYVGNERRDAYVTDEFVVDVAYGCRVVVTNPTSSPRKLELLLQIPRGAIPVQRGFVTRGVSVALAPYATSSIEYAFYFPRAGTMPHFPVHVSDAGKLIAFAAPKDLKVLAQPSKVDTSSWQHVSQNGTQDEVLQYLDRANLFRTDLQKIAWRVRERAFFDKVIGKLRARHVFHRTLWSYGIHHRDEKSAREFLRHANRFLGACGRSLRSPLVTIDPIERRTFQHVEYEPLFNGRAHRFGKHRRILNAHFGRQYRSLLQILCDRPALDDDDWMTVTYYMLLQDRVEDALQSFTNVDPKKLTTKIQHDYMKAYLGFYTADYASTRSIAQRHAQHPVKRWRDRFGDILAQLAEAEGKGVAKGDIDDRTKQQTAEASKEPTLELEVEADQVKLRYRNVSRVDVSYYKMDVEFLFSTQPFNRQGAGSFAYIKPNHSETKVLPKDKSEIAFGLPAELQNANLLVEVRANGMTKRQTYYRSSLSVHVAESYGQLHVTHKKDRKPARAVYVKVFARLANGRVRFHKDGYTDLRGRFDYASLSEKGSEGAKRFAILVLSQEHGAVIREVAAPRE